MWTRQVELQHIRASFAGVGRLQMELWAVKNAMIKVY